MADYILARKSRNIASSAVQYIIIILTGIAYFAYTKHFNYETIEDISSLISFPFIIALAIFFIPMILSFARTLNFGDFFNFKYCIRFLKNNVKNIFLYIIYHALIYILISTVALILIIAAAAICIGINAKQGSVSPALILSFIGICIFILYMLGLYAGLFYMSLQAQLAMKDNSLNEESVCVQPEQQSEENNNSNPPEGE